MPELPVVAPGYEPEDDAPQPEDVSGCLSNRCVIDETTLRRAMAAAVKGTPLLRVLRVAEPVLAVLALGLLIWAALRKDTVTVIRMGFLVAMLVYCYLQQFVLYPRRAVKRQLLRQARDDGTLSLENYLYFKPENVANRRGEAEELLHMPYDRVKRVTSSDGLIVITTRRKNLIPLDPDGFFNGTEADFWRLMRTKAPKAKLGRK